jgi:hypothetical protein
MTVTTPAFRRRLALGTGLALTLAPALLAGALAGCHDSSGGAADAAPSAVPLTPMGMASAATLVTATNAVEVLTKLHQPREAALGKDALYVLDIPGDAPDPDEAIDVMAVPLTVGGTATKAFAGQHGAEGLAFAGGRLVWITAPSEDGKQHSKIVSATPGGAGAAGKPATVAPTYDVDETLAVSDGADVFVFGDVKPGKSGPELLRLGAGGKPAVVTVGAGAVVRTALAVNATHVFWVQGGSVVRAPRAGGDAAPVVKLPAGKIQRLAADDTAVYWTDTGTGDPQWSSRVYRATIADGKVETISDAPSPFSIALDGDTVYWSSSTDVGGRILSRKKTGGATVVLAKEQHKPRGVAVDDKFVYWVNTGDGTVCRVAKAAH